MQSTLAIASTGSTNPVTAAYASGTGTGRLVFEVTMPSETADISLAAQTISLAGGTIVDKGTSLLLISPSQLAISSDLEALDLLPLFLLPNAK